jgi:hypothetical protein
MVQSQLWANRFQDPLLKIPIQKRADGVTQVVEHLSSKGEALSSSPSTTKKSNINKNSEAEIVI